MSISKMLTKTAVTVKALEKCEYLGHIKVKFLHDDLASIEYSFFTSELALEKGSCTVFLSDTAKEVKTSVENHIFCLELKAIKWD